MEMDRGVVITAVNMLMGQIEKIGDHNNLGPGVEKTPERVARAYKELFSGYKQDPHQVLTTFEPDGYDEMILLKGTEFTSMCEHHILPFCGRAHIAYLPKGKVIGVSKLARILDIYSRRLQIQERLTTQITEAIMEVLEPQGAACVIEAKHLCVMCRGVKKQNSTMVTSSLLGNFRMPEVRSEFFNLIKD